MIISKKYKNMIISKNIKKYHYIKKILKKHHYIEKKYKKYHYIEKILKILYRKNKKISLYRKIKKM